jgi:repressor LexA
MTISKRQHEVFCAIMDHILAHGHPPTVRELAQLVGIEGTNAVAETVARLIRRGHVSKADRRSRGIVIEPGGWDTWAAELGRRTGSVVTSDQARLITRVHRDMGEMGIARGLQAVRDLLARCESGPGLSVTSTPQ